MFQPTTDPATLSFRLTDWNPVQPGSRRGVGSRSELCFLVQCRADAFVVQYLHTEYFERETPVMPWRLISTLRERRKPSLETIILGSFMAQLLKATPVRLEWTEETDY